MTSLLINGGTGQLMQPGLLAGAGGLISRTLRPLSVGALGDSITAHENANMDLYNGGSAPSQAIITASYTNPKKFLELRSFRLHGAMRSNLSWFPFEWLCACTFATTQQVHDWLLPIFAGNPYGLPDACTVLAGTNDVANATPLATSVANLKSIYAALLGMGVTPIACTIPPLNNATQAVAVEQLNCAIIRLAQELEIPCADFYSAIVAASSTSGNTEGYWAGPSSGQAVWSMSDLIHPAPLGAAIMGYVLNNALLPLTSGRNRLSTALINSSASVYQNGNPNFLAFSGTHNASGSIPTTNWSTGGIVSGMSTVRYPGDASEPGTFSPTPYAPTPAVLGQTTTPNYQGNSWTLKGDGAHPNSSANANEVTYSAGDKLSFYCRVKWIPDMAATNPGEIRLGIVNAANGDWLGGIVGEGYTSGPTLTAPIGNESASYIAGDLYTEITLSAADDTVVVPLIYLGTYNGSSNTNTGDSLTIATMRVLNLTQLGLINP